MEPAEYHRFERMPNVVVEKRSATVEELLEAIEE